MTGQQKVDLLIQVAA